MKPEPTAASRSGRPRNLHIDNEPIEGGFWAFNFKWSEELTHLQRQSEMLHLLYNTFLILLCGWGKPEFGKTGEVGLYDEYVDMFQSIADGGEKAVFSFVEELKREALELGLGSVLHDHWLNFLATGFNGPEAISLSKTSVYSDSAYIGQGSIVLATNNGLPIQPDLNLQSGTLFELAGFSQDIANLSGSVTITNNTVATSSTLTSDDDAATGISAHFAGNLDRLKLGTGTLTLGGNLNHTGDTGSAAGMLEITNNARLAADSKNGLPEAYRRDAERILNEMRPLVMRVDAAAWRQECGDFAVTKMSTGADISTSNIAGYLSSQRLAEVNGLPSEAVRKCLRRWQGRHDAGWIENPNPGQNEPKFLYDASAVSEVIKEMKSRNGRRTKASGQRPPKN